MSARTIMQGARGAGADGIPSYRLAFGEPELEHIQRPQPLTFEAALHNTRVTLNRAINHTRIAAARLKRGDSSQGDTAFVIQSGINDGINQNQAALEWATIARDLAATRANAEEALVQLSNLLFSRLRVYFNELPVVISGLAVLAHEEGYTLAIAQQPSLLEQLWEELTGRVPPPSNPPVEPPPNWLKWAVGGAGIVAAGVVLGVLSKAFNLFR